MGTYAASLHVEVGEAEQDALRQVLRKEQTKTGLAVSLTETSEWVSVHADDMGFADDVTDIAKRVSKAMKARAVAFALFDGDDCFVEAFSAGTSQASATARYDSKPKLDAKAWVRFGADATAMKRLSKLTLEEPEELAFELADALELDLDILADEGDEPLSAKRGRK